MCPKMENRIRHISCGTSFAKYTAKTAKYDNTAQLRHNLCVPLKFSFGFSLTKGETNYTEPLKKANEKMYANKRERKSKASV